MKKGFLVYKVQERVITKESERIREDFAYYDGKDWRSIFGHGAVINKENILDYRIAKNKQGEEWRFTISE